MILNKKAADYLAYQSIASNNNFTEINSQNFPPLLEKINNFVVKYPNSRYGYTLVKNLLLGLRISIENNVDLNLANYTPILNPLITILYKSNYFTNDSTEEKAILALSYKVYSLYINSLKTPEEQRSPISSFNT